MGPVTRWGCTGLGIVLAAVAGASPFGLAASVLLFGLSRRWPSVTLVAGLPVVALIPVSSLLSLQAAAAVGTLLLVALPWWPRARALVAIPFAAGALVVAGLLASPLGISVASSDIATGLQAVAFAAGALVAASVVASWEPRAPQLEP